MQAYKLKGKIDQAGNLIVTESINLTPGEVEIIILQAAEGEQAAITTLSASVSEVPARRQSRVKLLQDWFDSAPLVSGDFDPNQAKWEYLKEKYNL